MFKLENKMRRREVHVDDGASLQPLLLFVHTLMMQSLGDVKTFPHGTHSHTFSKSIKSHFKPISSNPFTYKTSMEVAVALTCSDIFSATGAGLI